MAHPQLIVTSALKGDGMQDLRAEIARLPARQAGRRSPRRRRCSSGPQAGPERRRTA